MFLDFWNQRKARIPQDFDDIFEFIDKQIQIGVNADPRNPDLRQMQPVLEDMQQEWSNRKKGQHYSFVTKMEDLDGWCTAAMTRMSKRIQKTRNNDILQFLEQTRNSFQDIQLASRSFVDSIDDGNPVEKVNKNNKGNNELEWTKRPSLYELLIVL